MRRSSVIGLVALGNGLFAAARLGVRSGDAMAWLNIFTVVLSCLTAGAMFVLWDWQRTDGS